MLRSSDRNSELRLVVLELIKSRWNQGLDHQLFFYRDSHLNQVEIIFQSGQDLIPIEIKAAKTFNKSFLKGLSMFQKLVGNRCKHPCLIYFGNDEIMMTDVQLLNFTHAAQALNKK